MEEPQMIEKFICAYFLVIFSCDSIILVPIGMDYIKSQFPGTSPNLESLILGLVMSIFALAKGLTQASIIKLSQCWSMKGIFFASFLLLSASVLMISYKSFYLIFFSRFLCGAASNLQILSRKIIQNICVKEKTKWSSFCIRIIWITRLGMIFGILACGLLPREVPNSSGISTEKWFFLCAFLFFLYFSGFLLVFAMDTENLTAVLKNNYKEIVEDSLKNEQTNEAMDDKEKNTFNFLKIINSRKEINQTEDVDLEEVKSGSEAAAEQCINSPEAGSQASRRVEPIDMGVKKVHISIIEEDIEVSKVENQVSSAEIKPGPSSINLAYFFQVVLSIKTSLVPDSLPYIFYYISPSMPLLKHSLVISAVFVISSIAKFALLPALLSRFSYGKVSEYFFHISIIVLSFSSVLIILIPNTYIFAALYTLLLLSEDVVSPLGAILISDSVSLAERDMALEQNSAKCSIYRIISLLTAPVFIFSVHPAIFFLISIGFSLFSLWRLKKILPEFYFINQAPYYL